jgi:patatin-related protein
VAAVETPYAPTQEMRFALVLYGGVSLAIYINGVVQEFLHLVRATAPKTPSPGGETALLTDGELQSTEKVYRQLGQLARFGERVEARETSAADPILTRFVVDILSGSSAGGINGIFLAKALAHELEIDELSTLWVEAGGIEDLINDEGSLLGVPRLELARPPVSLLNSRRMYWQILNALDGMGGDDSPKDSRLVDELDLWVTMTDIRGLELPIDLMDSVVFENKYKAVLHFRYATPYAAGVEETQSHFGRSSNPLLAFAGRATASFPFAFDPMRLDDVDWAVAEKQFAGRYAGGGGTSPDWVPFFDEIVRGRKARAGEVAEADLYRSESFGDGGYLDNKPFTWATATLSRRRADLPVDRRLVYIEPDPTGPPPQFRDKAPPALRPWQRSGAQVGLVPNVIAAAHKLPRAETIREDLERLLERNREIARIRGIADLVDQLDLRDPLTAEEWRAQSREDLPRGRDPRYATYFRLKIDVALDELSNLVARVLRVEADSEYGSALRCVIQAWFDATYSEAPSGAAGLTEAEFLLRFDTPYRLRRLNYLDARIERLLRFDDRSLGFLARFADGVSLTEDTGLRTQVETALRNAKRRLSKVFVELRGELARLEQDNELASLFGEVDLGPTDLTAILAGARGQEESVRRAAQMISQRDLMGQLDDASSGVARKIEQPLIKAAADVAAALEASDEGVGPQARTIVSAALGRVHEHYEDYDSVLLPMGYRVVDESDPAEVIRISPQDADSLIDENARVAPDKKRTKLAGVAIHHFGGFFEQGWRKNDILWGRLDAAERIVETVLSAGASEAVRGARGTLLDDAQREIIREEFAGRHGWLLRAYLPEGLLPPARSGENLLPLTDDQAEAVRRYLKMEYQVPATLDPDDVDKLLGRVTRVTKNMLVGVAGTSLWARLGVRTVATGVRAYFRFKKLKRGASTMVSQTKRAGGAVVRRLRRLAPPGDANEIMR